MSVLEFELLAQWPAGFASVRGLRSPRFQLLAISMPANPTPQSRRPSVTHGNR